MANLSRKRTTNWNLFFGVVGQAHSVLVGIVFVPLYLSYLGVELWGHWLMLGSVFMLLGVMDLGITQGLLQRVAINFASDDSDKVARYCYSGILIIGVISLLIVILGGLFYFLFFDLFDVEGHTVELSYAYFLAVLVVPVNMFNNFFVGSQVAVLKPFGISMVQSFALISSALAQLYSLHMGLGLISLIWPNLLFFGLALCTNIFLSRRLFVLNSGKRIEKKILKDCLGIMRDLGVPRLFDRVSRGSYPALIGIFTGPELLVSFTICKRAAEFVLRLVNMIRSTIIAPMINARGTLGRENFIILLSQANSVFVFIALSGSFCYWHFNEYFVGLWVDPSHYLGSFINSMLAITLALQAMRLYFEDLLIMEGLNKVVLHIGILGLVSFGLEILVLILFGLEGMLLFTGISFAALLYFSANRLRFSYVEIFANTAEDLAKSKIFKFIALLCSVSLFLVLSAQSFIVVSLIVSLSVILSIRILGVDTWLKGYLRND
jgi:O-antigen/teichoic acid export membrane protein